MNLLAEAPRRRGVFACIATPHAAGIAAVERILAYATALVSLAAGLIHFSAAADHAELPLMRTGFLIVALLQVALGLLLVWRRPSTPLLAGALLGTVACIGLWVVSRTVGLPFVPGGHVEPVGVKDGMTVLFELAAIPGLLLLMGRRVDRRFVPSPRIAGNIVAVVGRAAS